MKHRIEWNGRNNILVLDNGPHGHIEMTLDEFMELADHLIATLRFDPVDDGSDDEQDK